MKKWFYTSAMNIISKLALITVSFLLAIPCFALELDNQQSVGLMGSQASPVNLNDKAVQKAIEALIKQYEKKNIDLKKKIPNKLDNPVGENQLRNSDKVLILGGAEAIPM